MGQIVGIYKICNIKNGKVYIGSSSNVVRRWNVHKRFLRNGCHSNAHLQRAWDKYGEDGFIFEVIELTSKSNLLYTEQKHIDCTLCFLPQYGYNIFPEAGRPSYSGENHPMFGKKHSRESKKKMSIAHKALKKTWKCRPVEQLSLNGSVLKIYSSMQDAAKNLRIRDTSSISRVVNGQRKQAHGFGWRYN